MVDPRHRYRYLPPVTTTSPSATAEQVRPDWRTAAAEGIRRLAPVSMAGALLGALVGGVVGRLAMSVLARANPEDTGVISDDGFPIGEFTVAGTAQLFLATAQAGLTGAVVYLAVRRVAFGPAWFRVLSISVGAGILVSSFVIHPGTDFSVLDPDWLPVAIFLVIPALFVALLVLLAERWLAPTAWFATADLRAVSATLLVWLLAGPIAVLLVPTVGVWAIWNRWFRGPNAAGRRAAVVWVARVGLGALAAAASVLLVHNIAAVT